MPSATARKYPACDVCIQADIPSYHSLHSQHSATHSTHISYYCYKTHPRHARVCAGDGKTLKSPTRTPIRLTIIATITVYAIASAHTRRVWLKWKRNLLLGCNLFCRNEIMKHIFIWKRSSRNSDIVCMCACVRACEYAREGLEKWLCAIATIFEPYKRHIYIEKRTECGRRIWIYSKYAFTIHCAGGKWWCSIAKCRM